jgi:nitroimidazol reductase NimA-like FMN-containing flavoprotein (pyridoxamine 5'-phosphate oxidase superfamily)
MTPQPASPKSTRTTVRRGAKRAHYGRDEVHGILRDGLVAHVAINTPEGPLVLPMVYGVHEETMYLHGAAANALLKASADNEVCATVTIVDGLVFAKTAFNHSMNYRSVVVRGKARTVTDPAEIDLALEVMTNHVVETSASTRPPSASEIRATRVVALPIKEASAKVRTGAAVNEPEDADEPYWSGVVPIRTTFEPSISNDDAGAPAPHSVEELAGKPVHERGEV